MDFLTCVADHFGDFILLKNILYSRKTAQLVDSKLATHFIRHVFALTSAIGVVWLHITVINKYDNNIKGRLAGGRNGKV